MADRIIYNEYILTIRNGGLMPEYKFSGERLQELRKDKKLTQKQLGKLIGASERTISSYERGEISPQVEKLIMIARILDISIDYICGITDDEIPATRKHHIPLPRNYSEEFRQEALKQIELLEFKFGYRKHKDE